MSKAKGQEKQICVDLFLEKLGFDKDTKLRYIKISEDMKEVKVGVANVTKE